MKITVSLLCILLASCATEIRFGFGPDAAPPEVSVTSNLTAENFGELMGILNDNSDMLEDLFDKSGMKLVGPLNASE